MVERSFDRDEFRPDPADRRREAEMQRREEQRRDEERRQTQRDAERIMRMRDVVNDPEIYVDKKMMKTINDPQMIMTEDGDFARVTTRAAIPRRNFSSQFASKGIPLPRSTKSKRKKNPQLAAAFAKANEMGRKKRGKGYKKGWDQSRIASTAHRLVRQGRV